MFPKISDLINALFGTHINLPIMSYGFFVAMAFLVGAYLLYLEFVRKEKDGLLKTTTRKVTEGKPASAGELLVSFAVSFFLAFKAYAAITDYQHFANDPQQFLFSSEGSVWIGLLVGVLYTAYVWYDKDKRKLKKPVTKEVVVHAHELTWMIVLVAAVFGIIGAKIFDQLENWQAFLANPWEEL